MMKRKIHNQKGMLCLEERDYDETDKRKDSSEYPILESSGCTADADSIAGGSHFLLPSLPDTIAVHWGVSGTPDRYGSRYELLIPSCDRYFGGKSAAQRFFWQAT